MNQKPYILWAEDDPDDLELFSGAIKKKYPHIQIMHAFNGREALQLLQHSKITPGLIVVDLNMPVMDGKDTVSYIRGADHLRHIPIVVLTTSTNTNEHEFFEHHQINMLSKPFRMSEVEGVVDELIKRMKVA